MGPKKNQITASTPAVANPSGTFGGISDSSGPSTINDSSFVLGNVADVVLKQPAIVLKKPAIPKVSTLDLVCKAIEIVGVPRKGASYMAIQKWIINNKENVEVNRLRANMKKAFVKALESGLLKRPNASKNVTGLRGYFILNKDAKHTVAQTAKGLIGKQKAIKIPKPKTATAPNPKAAVKSKSDTEEATSAKPKTKVVKSKSDTEKETSAKPKTKAAVKSKSNTEEATSAKPKNKAVKSKPGTEATSTKQKTKAVKSKPDTESGSSDKAKAAVKSNPSKGGPKTKAAAAKPISDSEDLPIPKQKVVRSRVDGVKVPTKGELNSVQIPKKVPKNTTSKPKNSAKDNAKELRPKKLYTSRINPSTNMSRKDLSDTELNVKPDNRKSLKSYSSDTEVDVIKRKKAAKVTKNKKVADAKKISDAGTSNSNAKKQKAKGAT